MKQLRSDLLIGGPVGRQARNLSLLSRQIIARLDTPPPRVLTRRPQLDPSTLSERLHPKPRKQLMSVLQLLARVQPPVSATQPLPIDQMSARELHPHTRSAQAAHRLAIKPLGTFALGEQGPRSAPRPPRPIGPSGVFHLRELRQSVGGALGLAAVGGCLDQLDQSPVEERQASGCSLARSAATSASW